MDQKKGGSKDPQNTPFFWSMCNTTPFFHMINDHIETMVIAYREQIQTMEIAPWLNNSCQLASSQH
jgi:hypothetical protein